MKHWHIFKSSKYFYQLGSASLRNVHNCQVNGFHCFALYIITHTHTHTDGGDSDYEQNTDKTSRANHANHA